VCALDGGVGGGVRVGFILAVGGTEMTGRQRKRSSCSNQSVITIPPGLPAIY
jgi:hypothetical protein